jgi:hypothetical protein
VRNLRGRVAIALVTVLVHEDAVLSPLRIPLHACMRRRRAVLQSTLRLRAMHALAPCAWPIDNAKTFVRDVTTSILTQAPLDCRRSVTAFEPARTMSKQTSRNA